MILSLIAAVAANKVIGKDNKLVWSLPRDMKYFMETTSGHYVITGRKNFESIPEKFRPLPNRTNIIVTRQPGYKAQGAIIAHSLEEALQRAKSGGESEVFIIGGGEIYRQSIGLADRIYITEVKGIFSGDTYFPDFNILEWKEISRVRNLPDVKHAYAFDFVLLERTKNDIKNQESQDSH
jgi:dihydrofolate reductase